MSIKKQIRKIGESVTIDYNSPEQIYIVSTSTTVAKNSSLKKALKELKQQPKPEKKTPKITGTKNQKVS